MLQPVFVIIFVQELYHNPLADQCIIVAVKYAETLCLSLRPSLKQDLVLLNIPNEA